MMFKFAAHFAGYCELIIVVIIVVKTKVKIVTHGIVQVAVRNPPPGK